MMDCASRISPFSISFASTVSSFKPTCIIAEEAAWMDSEFVRAESYTDEGKYRRTMLTSNKKQQIKDTPMYPMGNQSLRFCI